MLYIAVQVGGGLWIEDRQMVKQYAESLAKSRYAKTKEPSSCALFYIALGKKGILQVRLSPCLIGDTEETMPGW